MGFAEWVLEFKQLHEKARLGSLNGDERILYESARDDLASVVVCFQSLQLTEGVERHALRVACEYAVDLDLPDGPAHGSTEDLSVGGFAARLDAASPDAGMVPFTLHLPSGPVTGKARVVHAGSTEKGPRAAFAFDGVEGTDREHLELAVFDVVLSRFKS